MECIAFTINGIPKRIVVDPDKPLVKVIREDLRLTGTKEGCSTGHCGTCAVIVNGDVILSCRYPIAKVKDKNVITIEGIGTLSNPHPLQRAFAGNGAIQCGFCTPGMIVRAKALLDKNPSPTRDDIKQAIQPHLCRCTGYTKIFEAIERAVAFLRNETQSLQPEVSKKTFVGAEIAMRDGLAKATGTTLFADDIPIDGCAHIKVVRSPHHRAKIVSVDKSEALGMPGVLAVLTAEDVKGTNLKNDQPILCGTEVRMIGDPVAAVVADSEKEALDASEKVRVVYEELPAVLTAEDALQEGAPQVHAGNPNLFFTQPVLCGDVEKGFKEADFVLERDFSTQCVEHVYLENDSGIAYISEDGQLVVMAGSQNIYIQMNTIAVAAGEKNIRMIQTPTGGAFGSKLDITVAGIVAVAALAVKRPVKLVFTREETLAATTKRHPFYMKTKLGIKKDGTITAYQIDFLAEGGAYKSSSQSAILRAVGVASGPYRMDSARVLGNAVYTNTVVKGAMRGFGAPQVVFASESLIDEAARKIGMDRLEIRKRNGYVPGDVTIFGQTLTDNFSFQECLGKMQPHYERAVQEAKARSTEAVKRGVGLGAAFFGSGRPFPDRSEAWAELCPDDRLQIWIGAADVGQGSDTALSQIAAETFGCPLEKVALCSTDTKYVPDGNLSAGSRQCYVSGGAVKKAVEQLKKSMEENGCKNYLDMKAKGIPVVSKVVHETAITKVDPVDGHGVPWETYSFGVQMAEVAVEVKTGKVTVVKVTVVYDLGTVINRINVDGQMWGGIVMGIGYALSEEFVYNQTNSLAKVRIPRAKDVPEIEATYIETPRKNGPFGASGTSELCVVPTAAAVANAVSDACGLRIYDLPMTPDKVKKLLSGTNRAVGR
jgi:aldehyde oxidoreductase